MSTADVDVARRPGAFDARRAEAFAEEMLGVLNGGALALMLSLGHRAGLFDVMAGLAPASPTAIAEEAGLHERYVREWLAAMVAGGVVELEPESGLYRLPPEHAAVLTRASPDWNLAVTAQWIPMLGGVEDRLLACFERGGGVPATEFERFQAVMAEQGAQRAARRIPGRALALVPGLADDLRRGIDVLEVGCGSGGALRQLARAFPASRFRGLDLSAEAIGAARAGAAAEGLRNVGFELRDAADLRERGSCDLVTAFDSLPAQARPEVVLRGVFQALRPGGVLLVQDLAGTGDVARDADHPLGPLLYTISCLHTTTVSLAAGGAGAGAMWGRERLRAALAAAGFTGLATHALPEDPAHLVHVGHRPA